MKKKLAVILVIFGVLVGNLVVILLVDLVVSAFKCLFPE